MALRLRDPEGIFGPHFAVLMKGVRKRLADGIRAYRRAYAVRGNFLKKRTRSHFSLASSTAMG